jgi:hypothetical protein
VSNISRRNVIKGIAALPIVATLDSNVPGAPPEQSKPKPSRLADVGYVWEGQGFNRYLFPSIYGVGEGVRYFGLNKMVYMYHPNTRVAMEKLTSYSEVICDISKWKVRGQEDNSILKYHDGKIETKLEEARAVSDLSVQFPNVKGGYDDDLMGMIKKQGYTPDQYAPVYHELKRKTPTTNFGPWSTLTSLKKSSGPSLLPIWISSAFGSGKRKIFQTWIDISIAVARCFPANRLVWGVIYEIGRRAPLCPQKC